MTTKRIRGFLKSPESSFKAVKGSDIIKSDNATLNLLKAFILKYPHDYNRRFMQAIAYMLETKKIKHGKINLSVGYNQNRHSPLQLKEFNPSLHFELALKLRKVRRFSNFIFELLNTIHIAEILGVRKIFIPNEQPRIKNIFPLIKSFQCSHHPIEISTEVPNNCIAIEGDFYLSRKNLYSTSLTFPSRHSLAQSIIDFTGFAQAPSPSLLPQSADPSALTIHIRAGDIFKQKPHRAYGQPPLSFYLKVIKQFKPNHVILVYENQANPCIAKLIQYLTGEKIAFSISSSTNLRDDVKVLVHAQNIVIGTGTFAPGSLCFNQNLRKLFVFKNYKSDLYPYDDCIPKNAEIHEVSDEKEDYIKSIMRSNWRNTTEQVSMMLNYLEDYLVLNELPRAKDTSMDLAAMAGEEDEDDPD